MGRYRTAWLVFFIMFFCVMVQGAMLAAVCVRAKTMDAQNKRFANAVVVLSANNEVLRGIIDLVGKQQRVPYYDPSSKEYDL